MTDPIETTTRESRWLTGLVLLTALSSAGAVVVGTAVGVPLGEVYGGYIRAAGKMVVPTLLLFGVLAFIGAIHRGVKSPLGEFRNYLANRFGTPDEACGTLIPMLMMILILAAFGTLKQVMPLVAPFLWDDTFARIDRLLLFGHQPWQVTHALFSSPLDTQIINFIYFLWLPFLFLSAFGFSTMSPRHIRARFFISFGAAWLLLGVVAAFLLSSAGPCYAALVGASSSADFAPLMERLRTIDTTGHPIGALRWQAELWQAHSTHHYGLGLGISAMPSMHNAIAFLYVLAARRANLVIRAATAVFAAAILVGSVHLGWHYLCDGLFAWVAVTAIWWGAGAYLRKCGYVITPVKCSEPIPGAPGTVAA